MAATQSDDGPEDINEVEDTYALHGGWGTNENADRPNGDHEGSYQPFHPELPPARGNLWRYCPPMVSALEALSSSLWPSLKGERRERAGD